MVNDKNLENIDVEVVGKLISTTILLADGELVRLIASEKAIVKLILLYQEALKALRDAE